MIMPLQHLLLIFVVILAWGIGNLIAKKINTDNLISVSVWGSFIICLPMFVAALGPDI